LAERVDALAAGFLALGLERGARIGIWSLKRQSVQISTCVSFLWITLIAKYARELPFVVLKDI
jgi:hypothetical protein